MHKHKLITLKNGLRVIIVPMPQLESTTIMVGVGAGSRYETEKNNGISHFLEHMSFKGTKKRPTTLDIATTLDGIGATFNAFTDKELTAYFIKANAQHQELAFDVLTDMVFNSKFDSKEVEREKGTIIGEIDMYEDTPTTNIHNVFDSLIYGSTPLGWKVIGEKENIRKMKRQDFIDYQERFYFPSNMVVVGVGKIEEKKFLNLVNNYFGELKDKQKEGFRSFKFNQSEPMVSLKKQKTSQSHLSLGVPAYSYSHADVFPLRVLATVLGYGMSSRLFIQLRERRGFGYYVRMMPVFFMDNGYLITNTGVHVNKTEEAVRVILEEYKKITLEKVGKKELKKAKEFLKGNLILSSENSVSVTESYLYQAILEKNIRDIEEKIKLINKVTANDIQRVAKDIFKPEKLNLAVIGPYKDEEKFLKLLKF